VNGMQIMVINAGIPSCIGSQNLVSVPTHTIIEGECGRIYPRVRPVNIGSSFHHHRTNQDKCAPGSPGGNWRIISYAPKLRVYCMELTGGEDRGEKNGDEEAEPSHHGSDTGYSSWSTW